ncbi:MAG: metallophosphoesterase [Spirosoma sp.]|nr:metallophosphoesterase [Spirosoma sp.]
MIGYALVCGVIACRGTETLNSTNSNQTALNLLVIGDWGVQGQLHQQAVADQMEQYARVTHPQFIISTGDNFYPYGVTSVNDSLWKQSFERVYTGPDLQIPFKAILGNHDYEQTANPAAQLAYSKRSPRWQMPSRYYTEVVAVDNKTNLRLIYLDTNPFIKEYQQNQAAYSDLAKQDTQRQLTWLDSTLSHSPEPWKIVIGHHPLYSVGLDHGDQPELQTLLLPMLTKYGVQLYLCGHTHTLQHLSPGGPTDFVISGGGGAPLGSVTTGSSARFATAQGGFAALSITADSLNLRFINSSGSQLYQLKRGR